MDYEIEELLPLVSELSQKYSGFESTSITYERAQTLMGAVLYCLKEYKNTQTDGMVRKNISIQEQYRIGAKLVCEKAQNIQKTFNELSLSFEDYGVKCLYDTVQKGIPEFLKWYDAAYNPQNTILTLDYPLITDHSSLSGADAVFQYLLDIQTEQRFLGIFEKEYVVSVLKKYDPQYEYMIENICGIVLVNTIGHVVIKKPLSEMGFHRDEYQHLEKILEEKSVQNIVELTRHVIRELAEKLPGQDAATISGYLCHGAENAAVRMETAARFHQLGKIFVI